eukprot:scaffold254959_cov27-Tisochrysis_lutea.AAC.2
MIVQILWHIPALVRGVRLVREVPRCSQDCQGRILPNFDPEESVVEMQARPAGAPLRTTMAVQQAPGRRGRLRMMTQLARQRLLASPAGERKLESCLCSLRVKIPRLTMRLATALSSARYDAASRARTTKYPAD